MFAKLFDTTEGQILVKRDWNSDEEPEVKVYFEIYGGVFAIALAFGDEGKADNDFAAMTEEKAVELVRKLKDNIEVEKGVSE